MKKPIASVTASAAVLFLAGCVGGPFPSEIRKNASNLNTEVSAVREAERSQRAVDQDLVVRVPAPYLSGRTVALSKDARLPAVFKRSSGFVRPPASGGFTITQVADRIGRDYGVRVRIRPDVFLPASSLVPGSGTGEGASTGMPSSAGPMASPAPIVPPLMGAGAPMQPGSGSGSAPAGYDNTIDFDFTGSLSDYLARVSSKLGVNWEWSDDDQELVLYRLVRKTFVFDTAPTMTAVTSTVSKGSNTTTGGSSGSGGGTSGGSGSGGGNTGTGSISGNSQASLNLTSDAWTSVVSTLNRLRTKAGSVQANPATRTITMIDTRDVITDAERYMTQQSEILGRQVVLQVRMVRVSLSRTNQADANLELALQKIAAGATSPSWALQAIGGGSLTGGTGGSVGYTVMDPTRSTSGTNAVLQALREIGDVTEEFKQDVPVRNNRSLPISDFASFGYLAKTTPAASGGGGLVGGSSGVPGLEPGTVTSGTTIVLTPSITSGDSLTLLLSMDRSADPTFDTISTGSGDTFQQIQIPRQRGIKIDTEVAMRNNQTMVLMDLGKNGSSNTQRSGVLSVGNSAQTNREIQLLLVTPQIINGS